MPEEAWPGPTDQKVGGSRSVGIRSGRATAVLTDLLVRCTTQAKRSSRNLPMLSPVKHNGVWFPVDSPPVGSAADFLEAARAAAAGWQATDVRPADTVALAYLHGFLVEVSIPDLTCRRRTLRVMYTPPETDSPEPLLQSELGEDLASEDGAYFFDYDPVDHGPSQLYIAGITASPSQCGTWAAEWLQAQLQRPIVRREWDRPPGGLTAVLPSASGSIAAMEWWFTKPDQPLDVAHKSPAWWWWLVKRPPDREITERPDRRGDQSARAE